jgi:hypothetical protein
MTTDKTLGRRNNGIKEWIQNVKRVAPKVLTGKPILSMEQEDEEIHRPRKRQKEQFKQPRNRFRTDLLLRNTKKAKTRRIR